MAGSKIHHQDTANDIIVTEKAVDQNMWYQRMDICNKCKETELSLTKSSQRLRPSVTCYLTSSTCGLKGNEEISKSKRMESTHQFIKPPVCMP